MLIVKKKYFATFKEKNIQLFFKFVGHSMTKVSLCIYK